MSVETKWYIIEYQYPDWTSYETQEVMTGDEYEAIEIVKQDKPEITIQNVFVKINVKGVDYE